MSKFTIKIGFIITLLAAFFALSAGCYKTGEVEKEFGLGAVPQAFKNSFAGLNFDFKQISEDKTVAVSPNKDVKLELIGKVYVTKAMLTILGNTNKLESYKDTLAMQQFFYTLSNNSTELVKKMLSFMKASVGLPLLETEITDNLTKYKLIHKSWKENGATRGYLKITAE